MKARQARLNAAFAWTKTSRVCGFEARGALRLEHVASLFGVTVVKQTNTRVKRQTLVLLFSYWLAYIFSCFFFSLLVLRCCSCCDCLCQRSFVKWPLFSLQGSPSLSFYFLLSSRFLLFVFMYVRLTSSSSFFFLFWTMFDYYKSSSCYNFSDARFFFFFVCICVLVSPSFFFLIHCQGTPALVGSYFHCTHSEVLCPRWMKVWYVWLCLQKKKNVFCLLNYIFFFHEKKAK